MGKKSRRIIKNKKGFTLIEVIVVITIIVTLIAIVGPNMIGYINSAKYTSNTATARSIYIASMQVAANAAMQNKKLANETEIKAEIIKEMLLQGDAKNILKDAIISYEPNNYLVNSVTYLDVKYPDTQAP